MRRSSRALGFIGGRWGELRQDALPAVTSAAGERGGRRLRLAQMAEKQLHDETGVVKTKA